MLRSTKAGAEAPATQLDLCESGGSPSTAQRRPGPKPRRHAWSPRIFRKAGPAQRRPGPKPRRHAATGSPSRARPSTLNEGRGRSPGDTWPAGRGRCAGTALNEGRGRSPGDTRPPASPRRAAASLNEGRGRSPGDTRPTRSIRASGSRRSTKAGAEAPATRGRSGRSTATPTTLNEGRGRSPGDTSADHPDTIPSEYAQRRPGPKPRRHMFRSPIPVGSLPAQRRPGPKPRRHGPVSTTVLADTLAQRRPGPKPRRHPAVHQGGPRGVRRSTKAGAEAPATRGSGVTLPLLDHSLNEGRGRSPGDTVTGM